MKLITRIHVRSDQAGLLFRDGEFARLLPPGRHWLFDPLGRARVDVVNRRDAQLTHADLDAIVASGLLADQTVVLDLRDHERALVWVDNRFRAIHGPGRYVYWTSPAKVRVEVHDATEPRFKHAQSATIVRSPLAPLRLEVVTVARDHVGVLFFDGRYVETLPPGTFAFWKGAVDVRVVEVDQRETVLDVGGQDILTADKVTLRLNAVVTYRVSDARKAVGRSDDVRTALYREAQLVLRAVVGGRELDAFLTEKDTVGREIEAGLARRATELGLELASVGIRDVILPGEMKELLNKVTEARKAAEANLIARREETAAIRSQANTARLLADNPTLMRLRELEVLERIATAGNLHVSLGEKGLAERVINLL